MNKQEKIKKVMREFKNGKLKTADGKIVTSRKQALAIAMSESEDYTEKSLIQQIQIGSVREALEILEKAGSENLFEKAKHQVGDVHPSGKWVWTDLGNGRFDWRSAKGRKAGGAGGNASQTSQTSQTKPTKKETTKTQKNSIGKVFKMGDVVQYQRKGGTPITGQIIDIDTDGRYVQVRNQSTHDIDYVPINALNEPKPYNGNKSDSKNQVQPANKTEQMSSKKAADAIHNEMLDFSEKASKQKIHNQHEDWAKHAYEVFLKYKDKGGPKTPKNFAHIYCTTPQENMLVSKYISNRENGMNHDEAVDKSLIVISTPWGDDEYKLHKKTKQKPDEKETPDTTKTESTKKEDKKLRPVGTGTNGPERRRKSTTTSKAKSNSYYVKLSKDLETAKKELIGKKIKYNEDPEWQKVVQHKSKDDGQTFEIKDVIEGNVRGHKTIMIKTDAGIFPVKNINSDKFDHASKIFISE